MDKEELDRDWVKKDFKDKLKKLMKPEIVKGEGADLREEHETPEWGQHQDPQLENQEIPGPPKTFDLARKTTEVAKKSSKIHDDMKRNLFIKENSDFLTQGPNPLRIPESDFKNILNGCTNMYLAHEISVNKDFQLQQHVLPPDSLEGRVKEMMLKAFWDIFDQNTSQKKHNYEMAIQVFEEIKEKMLALLLPHNHTIRARIQEVLDMDLIHQQVEQDCIEFGSYMSFVVETLGQLCCPSRDEEIQRIKSLTKPSDTFKAILNTIDNMNLDMANYHIYQLRPTIRRHCIEYEQRKFADFLQWQYMNQIDGLASTRAWLLNHKNAVRDARSVLGKAYAQVLCCFDGQFNWPETLVLDYERLREIGAEAVRLSIIGASLLQAGLHYQPLFPTPCLDLTNKLRQMAFKFLSLQDSKDPMKVKECLESIAEQGVLIIGEHLEIGGLNPLTEQQKNGLRTGMTQPGDPENKIRTLILRRFIGFAEDMSIRIDNTHVPIPPGLNVIQLNAMEIVGQFQRITSYNQVVFQDLYFDIIEARCAPPTFQTLPSIEPNFLAVLNALRVPIERLDFLKAQQENEDEETEEVKYVKEGQHDFKLVDPTPADIHDRQDNAAKVFLEDLAKNKKIVQNDVKLGSEAKVKGIQMIQREMDDEENPFFKMINVIEKCKEPMKIPVNFIPMKNLIQMNQQPEKSNEPQETQEQNENLLSLINNKGDELKENEVEGSGRDSGKSNFLKKSSIPSGEEPDNVRKSYMKSEAGNSKENSKKSSIKSDAGLKNSKENSKGNSKVLFPSSGESIGKEFEGLKANILNMANLAKEKDEDEEEPNEDFLTYGEVKKAKYKNYSEIDQHFKLDFYERAKLRGDKSPTEDEEEEKGKEKIAEETKKTKSAKSDLLGLTG